MAEVVTVVLMIRITKHTAHGLILCDKTAIEFLILK
jgi:hypothetical protein